MAWERVEYNLDRIAVPGGWLYSTRESMVFVPHPTAQGEKVAPTEHDLDEAAEVAWRIMKCDATEKVAPEHGEIIDVLRAATACIRDRNQ